MKDRSTTPSQPGRLMALDVGTVKIGVALTDPLQLCARPLTTLRRSSLDSDKDKVLTLIREHEVCSVIVGLPKHLSGAESSTADCVRPLAEELRAANVNVQWQDERLSSRFAEEWMSRSKLPVAERGRLRDQYAAALILQWYLEERA